MEVAIVIYGQPGNPASTVGGPQPVMAIKGALDGIERQVRERRNCAATSNFKQRPAPSMGSETGAGAACG